MNIRTETYKDHQQVFKLIEAAFRNEEYTDHNEHHLVEKLRRSEAFIPELSLVAEIEGKIVGHILLTKIHIQSEEQRQEALALAPVSVLPNYQNKGIGARLINRSHNIARNLGYPCILLIGHEHYYPRFGYEPASAHGITFPFEAPDENCMVFFLTEPSRLNGVVEYPPEFFDE